MKNNLMLKKHKNLFRLSILCSIIGAIALFSIVFLQKMKVENVRQLVSYLIGSVFWLSTLIKILLIVLMDRLGKKFNLHLEAAPSKLQIGLVSFFQTPEGCRADIMLGISLMLILILAILKANYQVLVMMSISILYLSFDFHCFFNGRNFKIIKNNNGLEEREKNE